MNRRDFIKAMPVALTACLVGSAVLAPSPKKLADIYKLSSGEWVKVRMFELRKGDLFHHSCFEEVWKVTGNPRFLEHIQEWAVNCEEHDMMETATNKRT